MGQIYTLVNQKGGVGKTTTAINLGAFLGKYGQRVLLIDLDPQANATSCLGIDKLTIKNGTYEVLIGSAPIAAHILHNPHLKISLLPSSPALSGAEVELIDQPNREYKLREMLSSISDRYDYILIDCPPSLNLLTVNGLVAARDGVIIPVQCEYLALEGLGQLVQTLNKVRARLFPELKVRGVVMTMYDGRTRLATDVVAEVTKLSSLVVSGLPRHLHMVCQSRHMRLTVREPGRIMNLPMNFSQLTVLKYRRCDGLE
jgi:chromosome partitioning protein